MSDRIKNCLFGATNIVKVIDKEKYERMCIVDTE